MKKYNHAFTIAFEVISDDPEGNDVTADMLKAGLKQRIINLDAEGDTIWIEATGAPFDTYEV